MKWAFVGNNGGPFDGPNKGSEDHFKSSRLSSFVREIVQNSIDAKPLKSKEPVKIKFEIREVDKSDFDGFEGIWKHIEASRKQAEVSKDTIWIERYNEIIKNYRNKEKVKLLCVHDANTTGLTGKADGTPTGSLYAVTKGQGISSKQNDTSGGSFGHGASASFLFSGTRCVYYYSQVNGEEPKFRFQGKSMLQSHISPDDPNVITVGTGFYANDDVNKTPIINESIPKWARLFRDQAQFKEGTSVYIADTTFREDLYDETCISLIANFFFAFRENQLEAYVGEEILNKANIKQKFKEYKLKFEEDQKDEIDVDFISNCFKSIETVISPDFKDKVQIDGFGSIEWFLRVSDEFNWRKVGISRSIGMLITREPKFLEQFAGMKNFDMFVCVKGKEGNEILKKLENPKHDAFELDRVSDLNEAESQRIKNAYKKFTQSIRDIIKEYAQAEIKDQSIIEELADLFGELSDENNNSGNSNRGSKIIISEKIILKNKVISLSLGKGKKVGGKGSGRGETDNPIINKKKKVITYKGEKTLGFVAPDPKGQNIKLNNIRIGSKSDDGKEATIYFTNPHTVKDRPIIIYKKGETETELLDINGANTYSGSKDERICLKLKFFENIKDFVIEGAVNVET